MTVRSGSELSWRLSVTRDTDSGDEYDYAIGPALRLHNVRVVVEAGAKLSVGMAVEKTETEEIDTASTELGQGSSSPSILSTLMLEGAAHQVRC